MLVLNQLRSCAARATFLAPHYQQVLGQVAPPSGTQLTRCTPLKILMSAKQAFPCRFSFLFFLSFFYRNESTKWVIIVTQLPG